MTKPSNKYLPYILIATLVILIIFAMHMYIVQPQKEARDQLLSQNATAHTTIATLKEQINKMETQQNQEIINEFVLRKKLPATREIDQLLLYLEQLEMVADVRIDSIGLNNYDTIVQSSAIVNPDAPPEAVEPSTEGQSAEEQYIKTLGQSAYPTTAEEAVSNIAPSELPAELKMITLDLAIQAPSNEALKIFIKEIEKLERVIRIEQVNYTLLGEETVFVEEMTSVIGATIQLTTFYYKEEPVKEEPVEE